MRRREVPNRMGFEGQVLLDDFLYLWILMNEEWIYLSDFVEGGIQLGETPVFNTQNRIVEHISLPALNQGGTK